MDTGDRGPGENLFALREFEDFEILQRAVAIAQREGVLDTDLSALTFVEVGANIGTTTVPAVSVVGFRRALAIEPAPTNLRLLRANLALNDACDRVDVVPVAAGSKQDMKQLWLGQENHGDHRLWHSADLELQRMARGQDVAVLPLDQLAPDPEGVGLIWVDTQGYEGFVLSGATELQKAGVPFVTEFWPEGMRAAGSWDLFATSLSSAACIIDLRTAEAHRVVSRGLVERLADAHRESGSHTDLLFWFAAPPRTRSPGP